MAAECSEYMIADLKTEKHEKLDLEDRIESDGDRIRGGSVYSKMKASFGRTSRDAGRFGELRIKKTMLYSLALLIQL